jgi:hypothetical protein
MIGAQAVAAASIGVFYKMNVKFTLWLGLQAAARRQ